MKDYLDFFETRRNQRGLRVEAFVGRHHSLTVSCWNDENSPTAAGIHGQGRQSQDRILTKVRELSTI